MIVPQITYNPGSGNVSFTPTWPPTKKLPLDGLAATRHDSITSDGHKQSILERIDNMNTFSFETVPSSDIAAWQAFFSYALGGGSFQYAPDATVPGSYETYTLEDMSWVPAFVSPGVFSFKFSVRKVV